jgi:exopolyphosphatase/guanosine-5'-triphosphate,3'-diphosphate pyrophosphatase
VRDYANVNIEVIDGRTEANLIFSTFKTQKLDPSKTYLYIDVGGGSTEITLLKNEKRLRARSFKIGTVRILKGKVKAAAWKDMEEWVQETTAKEEEIYAIGTGGNINRLFKLSKLNYGELMSYDELLEIHEYVASLPFQKRLSVLNLRPDRADVIVPAGEIYIRVLKMAKIEYMSVPKIGLSDGIALHLYRQHTQSVKV